MNKKRIIGPVFIVGNSRSGTTLLARILSKHSLVHILNETHFMDEYPAQRNNYDGLSDAQRERLVNRLMTVEHKGIYRKNEYEIFPEAVEQILSASNTQKEFSALIAAFFTFVAGKKGKIISGDQTPAHVFHVRALSEIFPEAKFITMVRDPRAVLLSQKYKWKAAQKKHLPLAEIVRSFFNYHPITTSFLWRKGVEAGLRAKKIIPEESLCTLQFERLVADPQHSVESICDFLLIDFEPDMLNVHVSMTSNQDDEGKDGIRKEIADRWKTRLSATEILLCEQVNGHLAKQLGYINTRPAMNPIFIFLWLLYLPLHLGLAFVLNLKRMGNPVAYVMTKLTAGSRASSL